MPEGGKRGQEQRKPQSPEEIAQQQPKDRQEILGKGPPLERTLAVLSQETKGRR